MGAGASEVQNGVVVEESGALVSGVLASGGDEVSGCASRLDPPLSVAMVPASAPDVASSVVEPLSLAVPVPSDPRPAPSVIGAVPSTGGAAPSSEPEPPV